MKKNPNDHKTVTPKTKGKESDDKKFTSYNTSKKETDSAQSVRQSNESPSQQKRESK